MLTKKDIVPEPLRHMENRTVEFFRQVWVLWDLHIPSSRVGGRMYQLHRCGVPWEPKVISGPCNYVSKR